ncbi:MAG: OmpA family protein [Elusimicrobiota bacterium]
MTFSFYYFYRIGLIALMVLCGNFLFLFAKGRIPAPLERRDEYSLSNPGGIPIAAKETKLPLVVYGESGSQQPQFIASGYMGDGTALKITSFDESAPLRLNQKGRSCIRVSYSAKGRLGWAGMYWLTPANNWAKIKGAGFNLSHANKLTFWMRGARGGEEISQIKIGGLVGPYPDTDGITYGPIKLTREWKEYEIDLMGKDLRHIAGGFSFSVRKLDNPYGATFFVDEIFFDGKNEPKPKENFEPEPQVNSETPTDLNPTLENINPKLIERVKKNIPFSGARTAFSSETKKILDEIVSLAKKYPKTIISIEGHTDNVGSADTNKRLSLERANAVADYLESNGVDEIRMEVDGLGEEKPLTPESNDSPEGRNQNKRVEVSLLPEGEKK